MNNTERKHSVLQVQTQLSQNSSKMTVLLKTMGYSPVYQEKSFNMDFNTGSTNLQANGAGPGSLSRIEFQVLRNEIIALIKRIEFLEKRMKCKMTVRWTENLVPFARSRILLGPVVISSINKSVTV